MNNLNISSLLPAKALGCLDPEEDSALRKLMEEDDDFPWEELGQYQNLVSLLPTLLDVEQPERNIKDNVAKKLIELEEEKKTADETKKTESVEEEIIMENETEEHPEIDSGLQTEELVMEEELEIDEPELINEPGSGIPDESNLAIDDLVDEAELTTPIDDSNDTLTPPESLNGGISFKDHGMPMLPMEEQSRGKPIREKKPLDLEDEIEKKIQEKAIEHKKDRSYKSSYTDEPKIIVKKDKTALITAIVLFVIALAAIAFLYMKFNSDIENNKKEIEQLKNKPGATLFNSGFQIWDISKILS